MSVGRVDEPVDVGLAVSRGGRRARGRHGGDGCRERRGRRRGLGDGGGVGHGTSPRHLRRAPRRRTDDHWRTHGHVERLAELLDRMR